MPHQIYQMISRARQQNKVHIYCNERESYIKYNKERFQLIKELNIFKKLEKNQDVTGD